MKSIRFDIISVPELGEKIAIDETYFIYAGLVKALKSRKYICNRMGDAYKIIFIDNLQIIYLCHFKPGAIRIDMDIDSNRYYVHDKFLYDCLLKNIFVDILED